MKSKIKKINGASRELEIEIFKEAVDKMYSDVLEEIRRTANVPGFRTGKAPMDIIEKNYKLDAADEVKRRLIPIGYQEALDAHKLSPVSYPEISDLSSGASGTITFKAKVDIYPDVNPKKYKALRVEAKKITVDEKEVDEAIARIGNMHAEFLDVDRPLDKGDFGICDVETTADGVIIAKKRPNMWIEASKEASLLGLGEKLQDMKKGDVKDMEAVLPADYPDKKYAGKRAVFRVEVKGTKEKRLPELNDEFAKKIGKETMQEVREEIMTQLRERKRANSKVAQKNQILEQLLLANRFDCPPSIVEKQLDVLMDKTKNGLLQKGLNKEAAEADKEKLRGELAKEAEDKVRTYFILDKIAEIEKIYVNDAEVDEWLKTIAANYGRPFEEVKKYYDENGLVGGLKEQLREDKTLDFLLSEASVTEK